jgi:hypothetical protein
MTRIDRLEFVDDGLIVSYCASVELQDIRIAIDFSASNSKLRLKERMLNVRNTIEYGFAGSDVYAPQDAKFEVVKMPPYPSPPSEHCELELRLGSIAPIAIRTFVETLRLTSNPPECITQAMTIRGSRPLDTSSNSVTEKVVREWLDDPGAAPRPWGKVPFELHVKQDVGREDAVWRVVLEGEVTAEIRNDLQNRAICWIMLWKLDAAGQPHYPGFETRIPKCSSAEREFTARFKKLRLDPEVMRGLAVNTLVSFHHKVAPIARVELSV